jgi:hypothetical protein
MKFVAILKDSLREALDTKVLYFTVGLSLLVVLLVGSLSFRRVPLDETMNRLSELTNFMTELKTQGKGERVEFIDFEQTNSASEPWLGDYRYVMVLKFSSEKEAAEVRQTNEVLARGLKNELIGSPLAEKAAVTPLAAEDPKEVRFRIETWGTKINDRRRWIHEPALFFGALPLSVFQLPLNDQLMFITYYLIGNWGAGITMLLGCIITAFFIPNMLRKGTVDLLLSKPIHRVTLLSYKFLGGLTFMFVNTLIIMVGIWLVLGLRTGVWINGWLPCVFVYTFQFAIYYSISTLMGVLTRSPIVAILMSVAAWPVLFGIGIAYPYADSRRPDKLGRSPDEQSKRLANWVYPTVDFLHFVTPHYADLDYLTKRLINRSLVDPDSANAKAVEKDYEAIRWDETILVTIFWIAGLLAFSCWWFSRRDY